MFIYILYITKKLQFAAYGQFVLDFFLFLSFRLFSQFSGHKYFFISNAPKMIKTEEKHGSSKKTKSFPSTKFFFLNFGKCLGSPCKTAYQQIVKKNLIRIQIENNNSLDLVLTKNCANMVRLFKMHSL